MADIEQIKELRDATGAGVNAVREALKESDGDMEKAMKYLRKKGVAKADKRKDKVADNGILGTYVHQNNRLVVVVEVACETDFAAKSDPMKKFANDVALHIAAKKTKYISEDNIDPKELKEVKETFEKELEGKPDNVKEKIIEGKLQKYYQENVLMKQNLFTDDSKTVEDYLNESVAKLGEKIEISKFVKMEIAGSSETCGM